MIFCGSGQRRLSVIRPNWTPPAYETMLTPTPTSPEDGTQKMLWRKVLPQNTSGMVGPGTFVITAVVFFRNTSESASCSGLVSNPDTPSSA